jgi:hypothetical protein
LTVCRLLASLGEPAKCTAWNAQLNVPGLGFESDALAILVLAPSNDAAARIVQEVWEAMHAGQRPPLPIIQWQRLPKDQQPPDSVPPGIYGIQSM